MGRVYNFRSGCMQTMHLLSGVAIQPNLELKTQPKPVLGSLPLAFALPSSSFSQSVRMHDYIKYIPDPPVRGIVSLVTMADPRAPPTTPEVKTRATLLGPKL